MTEKIRVAQIIKTLNIGGAERFGLELAIELDKDQFSVEIIVFFKDGSEVEQFWEEQLRQNGLRVEYLAEWKGNNQFANYLIAVRRLRKHLREMPVDILNSHFQLGTLAALYSRWTGLVKRVIRTAHNHPRNEWDAGLYGLLRYQIISKWVYPLFLDAEIAVSETIANEIRRLPGQRISRHPVLRIYNAISGDVIETDNRQKRIDVDSELIIGSIGRLAAQKGHIFFLRAMPAVIQAYPNARFWLIGEGEDKELLENEAEKLALTKYVKFLGKRSDALEFLRKMDLFVLPSIWEGLPTVLLEAAANDIPVVATDIPGNDEIIENEISGWLVPPGDAASLSSAIIDAIGHPEARMQRAMNAKTVLNQFMMDNVALQYAKAYKQAMGQLG